jgi:hypothetical protein
MTKWCCPDARRRVGATIVRARERYISPSRRGEALNRYCSRPLMTAIRKAGPTGAARRQNRPAGMSSDRK